MCNCRVAWRGGILSWEGQPDEHAMRSWVCGIVRLPTFLLQMKIPSQISPFLRAGSFRLVNCLTASFGRGPTSFVRRSVKGQVSVVGKTGGVCVHTLCHKASSIKVVTAKG